MTTAPDDEIIQIEVSNQEGLTTTIASQKEEPDQSGDSHNEQQLVDETRSDANPQDHKTFP